jgi:hypothetical protein
VARTSVADEPLGFFGDHAQHSFDDAHGIRQRAVRKRVVALLGIAAALEQQHEALVPRGDAGRHDLLNARFEVGPDFRPDFPRRPAQRPGCLTPSVGAYASLYRNVSSSPHPIHIAKREVRRILTVVFRLSGQSA